MSLPLTLLIAGFLLLFGAIFSGLNIGLMMVRPAELKRKAAHGDQVAARLYHYRKNGTYLIVCILLGGTAVVSALSLVLESVAGGILAGIITTGLVTVFGEIIPQTIFVRKGYAFSRHFFWLLNLIYIAFWPVAKPLTLLLDKLLGEELPNIYTREELTHLVNEHAEEHSQSSGIDIDESRIVKGALAYSTIAAKDAMTPLVDVISLQADDLLDASLLSRLKRFGHSRFPVYDPTYKDGHTNDGGNGERSDVAGDYTGILYMKDVLGEELPSPVSHLYRDKIFDVPADSPLDTVLSRFIQTKSHLFLVRSSSDQSAIGIITIEDVIEKILNREIADEFDPQE